MKTVDIVDKSGLPVAAGGVELTEKDLRCIAMHMKHFFYNEIWKEDRPFPCAMCWETFKDKEDCKGPDYHFYETFSKIEKIVGATIWDTEPCVRPSSHCNHSV